MAEKEGGIQTKNFKNVDFCSLQFHKNLFCSRNLSKNTMKNVQQSEIARRVEKSEIRIFLEIRWSGRFSQYVMISCIFSILIITQINIFYCNIFASDAFSSSEFVERTLNVNQRKLFSPSLIHVESFSFDSRVQSLNEILNRIRMEWFSTLYFSLSLSQCLYLNFDFVHFLERLIWR